MDTLAVLIETLKLKEVITDLESDILETFKEYRRDPFDRKAAEKRMDMNYTKYNDIFKKAAEVPGVVYLPSSALSDEDILSNLQYQLLLLAKKEWEAQHSG